MQKVIQYQFITQHHSSTIRQIDPFNSLFPGQPRCAGTRKVKSICILMTREIMGWQWHQLHHVQIIYTSLQRDNHASTSSLIFYRPDAFCRLDAAPLEDATIYACLSANCNGTGAYPREYKGTCTSKWSKLDLRTDAKYVANLAKCQYVLVNMQKCRLLHRYSMPA